MERITLTKLKKYLSGRPSSELINEISELFKTFPEVRDYYESRLISDGNDRLLSQCKESVEKEFFPANGLGAGRLSVPRKAIAEFKKVSSSAKHVIDLILFSVEMAIEYTSTFGDMNETYYRGIERLYGRALELIYKGNLQEEYSSRCRKIVKSTIDFAWGFNDNMREIHYHYF